MIVVTGAYGFIGSCLVYALNALGYELILVDDFGAIEKEANLAGKKFNIKIDRLLFPLWFERHKEEITFVFHLGARTDTTSLDVELFNRLNLNYSMQLWELCSEANIPFIYASSAATYGDGKLGFDDNRDGIAALQPLNAYGWSKQNFDIWALSQQSMPPKWVGLKFFNVYGPNEYHKARMASVVFHSYQKIKSSGSMQLFRSHVAHIKDGHQSRDFIYVKDIVEICLYLLHSSQIPNGIYNAGSGKARTFLDLVNNTFKAMKLESNIEFVDTPLDIRENYQYYTEAKMQKLTNTGFHYSYTSLEDGIADYVNEYLQKDYKAL